MWEEEKDFEILGEVDAYEMNDESTGDFIYSELDSSVDENENSDVFDYEADFYHDEEDE
jgi:hypothetical protein